MAGGKKSAGIATDERTDNPPAPTERGSAPLKTPGDLWSPMG